MTHDTHDTHDPKFCREMFEKLSEYIDKELDEVTCKDIEEHSRDCIPCQVCLGTLKQAIDLFEAEITRLVREFASQEGPSTI